MPARAVPAGGRGTGERVSEPINHTMVAHLTCPECGQGRTRIDHLTPGQPFGPWYCDECGWAYRGVQRDGYAEIERRVSRKVATTVYLRLEEPVTLVVDGMRVPEPEDEPGADHDRYYYEEHTCPSNAFRCVRKVIADDGDEDPHGILTYLRTEKAIP